MSRVNTGADVEYMIHTETLTDLPLLVRLDDGTFREIVGTSEVINNDGNAYPVLVLSALPVSINDI